MGQYVPIAGDCRPRASTVPNETELGAIAVDESTQLASGLARSVSSSMASGSRRQLVEGWVERLERIYR